MWAGSVEIGGERGEGLRHREGPGGAVPGALVGGGEAEARAAALGGGGAEFAVEALGVEELMPGDAVGGCGRGVGPGVVADELADAGELEDGAGVDEALLGADAGVFGG